jgi:hypothetical protein
MEERLSRRELVHNFAYYVIIGVISLFSLTFLPFIGSSIKGSILTFENASEFILWITSKIVMSIINVLIFHLFVMQAKVNIEDREEYVEALKKLNSFRREKRILPRSPKEFNVKQYTQKTIIIIIFTILSTVIVAEAVLKFDLVVFLSYLLTIIMSISMGYLSMKTNEIYWVSEFPLYVELITTENTAEKEAGEENQNDNIE